MSLSRNSEGGIGEVAFLAAASFDAAKLEDRKIIWLEKEEIEREREREGGDRIVMRK